MNNIVRPSHESLKLDDIILPPHLKPKGMQGDTELKGSEIPNQAQSLDEAYSWGRESSKGGFMQDLMDDEEEYYRVDEHEREELSAPILLQETAHRGLGTLQLRMGFVILGAILLLAVPKVYLTSSIYYMSKEISALQTQYDMLHEQNKQLKHNVEDLRYKYMILGE